MFFLRGSTTVTPSSILLNTRPHILKLIKCFLGLMRLLLYRYICASLWKCLISEPVSELRSSSNSFALVYSVDFQVNTSYLVRTAHRGPITCICFSPDSKLILSRGLDDSLKLWSLSDAKKPLQEKFNLENGFKGWFSRNNCFVILIFIFRTDCGFSPRGELVFTGTSSPNSQIPGQLLFFNTENFDLVYKIDFSGVVDYSGFVEIITFHFSLALESTGIQNSIRFSLVSVMDPSSKQFTITANTFPKLKENRGKILLDEIIFSSQPNCFHCNFEAQPQIAWIYWSRE